MVGRSRGVVVRVRDVMNGEDGGVARKIASCCGISGAAILNVLIPSLKTPTNLCTESTVFLHIAAWSASVKHNRKTRAICRPTSD